MKDARRLLGAQQPKLDSESFDQKVAWLAGRQHGAIGRRQLGEIGLTDQMIKTRVAHGGLNRVHRGVYAVGHRAMTMEGRWMAAVLAHGPRAALSHRSAGQLWGIVPRSPIAPEVTAPGAKRTRKGIIGHRGRLLVDEVRWVLGIPVTSVPRTTLDLAATRPGREVERAWNETEVLELTDVLSVPDLLERYPGRPGSALLTRLASQKTRYVGRTRNELEEAFLALVDRSGLPRPRMNVHLPLRDHFFEVDCLWEDLRVAIELDGGAVHRTTKAFHKDRERDRILTAERWTTTRVTWQHIEETPAELVDDLRQILTPYP